MIVDGAISWRSITQNLVSACTMEAEFASCFHATSHGVWIKSSILGLRFMDSISSPLRIFCNDSVVVCVYG
jgi:hypothetical protein